MRSVHVLAVVCSVLLLGSACNKAAEITMSAAVQVTDARQEIAHLTVATDTPRQRVYVAWTTYPSDEEGVNFLAISHDGGRSFREPVALPGRREDHPVLRVTRDGTLLVAWTRRHPTQRLQADDPDSQATSQMLMRSADGGKTFVAPLAVPDARFPPQAGYFMSLAVSPDGATVSLSWFDYTPALEPVGREAVPLYAATSHDGGQTFNAPVQVAEHVCVCCMPEGIVRDNHPAFVLRGWVAGNETEGDVRNPILLLSRDAGDTWFPPITIHDDGFRLPACPHVGFGADVDRQQRIHVAWWTGAPQRAGYWYALSDTGTTFAAPRKLLNMPAAPHGNNLSLVIDAQETAWIAAITFAAAHHHAASSAADLPASRLAVWAVPPGQPPRFIDQVATPGAFPKLAAMAQGVVLVWVEGTKVMLRHIGGT